jgi:hypothetical protein
VSVPKPSTISARVRILNVLWAGLIGQPNRLYERTLIKPLHLLEYF